MIIPSGHIPRWIKASIATHFEDRLSDTIPMYVEGEERDTNEETDFIELRVDGPFISIPSKNFYNYDISIDVLIQSILNRDDSYKLERNMNLALRGFELCIPVFKYQNGGEIVGILKMRNDLDINNFGIIRPDTRINQSSIEASYRMCIKHVTFEVSLNVSGILTTNIQESL
jgi:hypothetical protein